MDIQELKKQFLREELGISDNFGAICAYVDFGNVNYWFGDDRQDSNNTALKKDEKIVIDLEKLKNFSDVFAKDQRFYYGHDPQNRGSFGFIRVAKEIFGARRVFTKQIQYIRHHLTAGELSQNTRSVKVDTDGFYVKIPKCNFDVEIAVDAIRNMEKYDTFCLFSGDADFVHLLRFLKSRGKKIILIKGGNIVSQLKEVSDLVLNAQNIKKHISAIKQKPG